MYRTTVDAWFPYGHRLVGHSGGCGRLHGHNGRVEVVVAAEALDERGFVADFDEVDAALRAVLATRFDHRMLLHRDDPVIPHLDAAGEDYVALEEPPSAEVLARLLFEALKEAGLPVEEVRLWETASAVAAYREG